MDPIVLYRRLSPVFRQFLVFGLLLAVGIVLHAKLGHSGLPFVFAVTAAMNTANPNLFDVVRQKNPNGGGLLNLIEALSLLTPFVEDATWIECNNGTFHRINTRNVLPTPSYRVLNQGVLAKKSKTQQVDETTSILPDASKIDVALIKLNGPEYRVREVSGHMMGMINKVESDVFYSSTATAPKQFEGLAPRFAASTATPAGAQVLKADAAAAGGDQSSVFLIGWGPHAVHMVYPTGASGPIAHKDYGEVVLDDGTGSGALLPMYFDWFEWYPGLAVEDYRYACRLGNIDTSNLSSTGTSIIEGMIKQFHQVQYRDKSVRWAYYGPRTVGTFLHLQARAGVTQSTLKIEEIGGNPITKFLGIPFRETDGLVSTESVLS